MGRYLSEQETRERMTEAMRQSGFEKRNAEKQADASVGRVVDNLARKAGMPPAERPRKP